MLVKPMIIKKPFQQWGIDFISIINLKSSMGHKFILTTIDYFIRWSKAMPCKNADQEVIIKIIKIIITHFGIPYTIISDNNTSFTKAKLSNFVAKYRIY